MKRRSAVMSGVGLALVGLLVPYALDWLRPVLKTTEEGRMLMGVLCAALAPLTYVIGFGSEDVYERELFGSALLNGAGYLIVGVMAALTWRWRVARVGLLVLIAAWLVVAGAFGAAWSV